MPSLQIPAHISLAEVELLRERLKDSPNNSLIVPPDIVFSVSGESSYIHWLSNWGGRVTDRHLSFARSVDEPAFMRLDAPYVLAMALCSTRVEFEEKKKNPIYRIRRQLAHQMDLRQANLFSADGVLRGRSIFCADSLSEIPPPSALYQQRGDILEVRDLGQFTLMLRDVTSGPEAFVPLFQETENAGIESGLVPQIIFELFKNTHDHARRSISGVPLPFSLRGIYMHLHEGIGKSLGDTRDRCITTYIDNLSAKLNLQPESPISLLEIAVFDSGPGLAQHFSKKNLIDLTLLQEKESFEACFKKHSSAAGDYQRGLGLDRVQREISKTKGLLLVRTGRLAMYRDFSTFPFGSKVFFNDTESLGLQLKEHPQVDGAYFCVLIPCRRVE